MIVSSILGTLSWEKKIRKEGSLLNRGDATWSATLCHTIIGLLSSPSRSIFTTASLKRPQLRGSTPYYGILVSRWVIPLS
jgi:hypothetical protein